MCLVGLSLLAGTAMAGDSLAEMIAGPDWPHSHAQFKPDSEARFGRLDTGLRYVIYRNTAQGRGTSMRFLVAAGSLQERDDQLGIAHFVEHMAFRGSKNLKDGELKRIVEAEGGVNSHSRKASWRSGNAPATEAQLRMAASSWRMLVRLLSARPISSRMRCTRSRYFR
jgi:hypothetical protein